MKRNDKIINCPACELEWTKQKESIGGVDLCLCSNCGLWFCNPFELAKVDYNEIYKTVEYQKEMFEDLDSVKDWIQFSMYPTYSPFFREVERSADAKLLDIGCGVGRFCRAAYSHGWDVKGIDVSEIAIAKAKEEVPFPMLQMTAKDMMESGERFNVITSFEVIEHLSFPIEMLKICTNLLEPGGKFFCTVPNIGSLTVRASNRRDWLPPVHVLYFTELALHELLCRAGFSDVRTGIIWINEPPTASGLNNLKYYINRLIGRTASPDPLGLWAVGSK